VLPAAHRMRRADQFSLAVRRGYRAGRTRLVVHLSLSGEQVPATAGFVVSRAVGGAVVRNLVKRRLRHLVADRLDRLPPGALLVVRALPPAATAGPAELGADLDGALASALRRAARSGDQP
jgi:ribonuclease P protein component